MKKVLLWILSGFVLIVVILLVLSLLPSKISNINVAGYQFRPQIWSGKITVAGDVIFVPWVKLTVEPGTRVEFEKGQEITGTTWTKWADAYIKDHNDPTGREGYNESHYEITGKVIAKGTTQQPIVFTSPQLAPEYADWDQLVLLSGSILDNIELSFAHNGINIEGNNTVVKNSTIHDSLWSCIDVYGGNNTIENNTINHCWHQAVGVKKVKQSNIIKNNRIGNAQLSVNCELGATPIIENNTIKAAPLNPDCGDGTGNKILDTPRDTTGGTYNGKLIYPST